MEMIKKGVKDHKWYGECSQCKAIFKSDKKELSMKTELQGGDYRSDYEYFFLTSCDYCNSFNSVNFYSELSKTGKYIYQEAIPQAE